jgi:hypothetical protein
LPRNSGRKFGPKILVLASGTSLSTGAGVLTQVSRVNMVFPRPNEDGAHALVRVRPALVLVEVGRRELESERFLQLVETMHVNFAVFGDDNETLIDESERLAVPAVGLGEPLPIIESALRGLMSADSNTSLLITGS